MQASLAFKIWQTGCYKMGMNINMRLTIFTALCLLGAVSAWADKELPALQVGNNVYRDVTVTTITATDVYFTYNHGNGMANAKLKNLSPELQKYFHYDPAKADEAKQKQAQANAEYHNLIISQPTVRPPDESRPAATEPPSKALWRTDLPGALDQARSENKLVLLDFTGSDWCPWCIKFDKEVLSTDQFADYADARLVLVKLDFPRHTEQDAALKQANQELYQKFNVNGYPTYILLNPSGRELGRQVGYQPGGPDAFIAELDGFGK